MRKIRHFDQLQKIQPKHVGQTKMIKDLCFKHDSQPAPAVGPPDYFRKGV